MEERCYRCHAPFPNNAWDRLPWCVVFFNADDEQPLFALCKRHKQHFFDWKTDMLRQAAGEYMKLLDMMGSYEDIVHEQGNVIRKLLEVRDE